MDWMDLCMDALTDRQTDRYIDKFSHLKIQTCRIQQGTTFAADGFVQGDKGCETKKGCVFHGINGGKAMI